MMQTIQLDPTKLIDSTDAEIEEEPVPFSFCTV